MTPTLKAKCLKLHYKNLTISEIAAKLNLSASAVCRVVPKRERNYYDNLILETCYDLKRGEICYCFTKEQLADIRARFPHFTAEPNGVGYTLLPPKRGYKAMREWLTQHA